jgi:hypothetical protein
MSNNKKWSLKHNNMYLESDSTVLNNLSMSLYDRACKILWEILCRTSTDIEASYVTCRIHGRIS